MFVIGVLGPAAFTTSTVAQVTLDDATGGANWASVRLLIVNAPGSDLEVRVGRRRTFEKVRKTELCKVAIWA